MIYGPKLAHGGYVETVEALVNHPAYKTPLGPNQGRGVASGYWFNGGGESSANVQINADGTVTCQSVGSGTVTAVTALAPLVSSGGTTPNISLPHVTIGANNTAIGSSALLSNTTGIFNTASGASALSSNTTGNSNTASGIGALFSNTGGADNTASGTNALFANTTGGGNTASGVGALGANTTGGSNTASGFFALLSNTTGFNNTASGVNALVSNTTGTNNTAIGAGADVCLSCGNLTNATAIGAGASVDASNKIRLGNTSVAVIEAPVGLTVVSDQAQKENFQPVDGEEVLGKIRTLTLTSWNLIGHDPRQFRHYGPVSQEFFAAFGHDGIGTIGTPTTITSTDMAGVLMIAVQALETRTAALQHEHERLKEAMDASKAESAELRARLEALEKLTLAKEALAQK